MPSICLERLLPMSPKFLPSCMRSSMDKTALHLVLETYDLLSLSGMLACFLESPVSLFLLAQDFIGFTQ